jgi:hypothetical protein
MLNGDLVNLSFDSLFVCRRCGSIYGDVVRTFRGVAAPWPKQLCRCSPAEAAETWPGYDFPEAVALCRCCGRRALPSGSQFSIWFCRHCRPGIQAVNRACGSHMVPLGRYSLLEQIGLDEDDDRIDLPGCSCTATDWFKRIDRLERHAASVVLKNLEQWPDVDPSQAISLARYFGKLSVSPAIVLASLIGLGAAFELPEHVMDEALRAVYA